MASHDADCDVQALKGVGRVTDFKRSLLQRSFPQEKTVQVEGKPSAGCCRGSQRATDFEASAGAAGDGSRAAYSHRHSRCRSVSGIVTCGIPV